MQDQHPFTYIRKEKLNKEQAYIYIKGFLNGLAHDREFCLNLKNKPSRCKCFKEIIQQHPEWVDFMAPFLYSFYNLGKKEKDEYLFNTIRTGASQKNGKKAKHYPIPSTGKPNGVEDQLICHYTFFNVMQVGERRYLKLMTACQSTWTYWKTF